MKPPPSQSLKTKKNGYDKIPDLVPLSMFVTDAKGLMVRNKYFSLEKQQMLIINHSNAQRIKSEVEACNIENMIRSSLGIGLRMTYDVPIFLDTKYTPGSSLENVIQSKDKIIYNGRNDVKKYYQTY